MGVGLQYILCQYMMYKPASSCIYVCASNFEAPICINLPKHHTQTSSMFGTQTPEPILQTWRTPQQQRGNLSEIEALATSCLCLFSSKMDIFKHRVCIYICTCRIMQIWYLQRFSALLNTHGSGSQFSPRAGLVQVTHSDCSGSSQGQHRTARRQAWYAGYPSWDRMQ